MMMKQNYSTRRGPILFFIEKPVAAMSKLQLPTNTSTSRGGILKPASSPTGRKVGSFSSFPERAQHKLSSPVFKPGFSTIMNTDRIGPKVAYPAPCPTPCPSI